MIKELRELADAYWEANDEEYREISAAADEIMRLQNEVSRLRAENTDLRIKTDVIDQSAEAVEAENERLRSQYEDMTSIALWTTRRLAYKQHKDFAYDAIERNLGREVERV